MVQAQLRQRVRNGRQNQSAKRNQKNIIQREESKKVFYSVIVIILGIILSLGVTQYLLRAPGDEDELGYDTRPISEILQEQVDQCETLITMEVQVENALAEDPFVQIVKDRIQPALDTVASVRTQTAQYEAMERIPGGPTTFIEGAFKRLNDIDDNIINFVRDQETRILTRKFEEISTLVNHYETYHKESLAAGLETIRPLHKEGIALAPGSAIGEAEMNAIMAEVPFQEVINKLGNLAKLYETLEGSEARADVISKKYETESDPDAANESLDLEFDEALGLIEASREKIEDDIEANGKYYKMLLFYRRPLMLKVIQFSERLLSYEIEKKQRYRKLIYLLEEDAAIARTRLENLKRA